jgi:hypothetical protein
LAVVSKSKLSGRRPRGRSAFREEFYADRRPDVKDASAKQTAAQSRARKGKGKVPAWLPAFSLLFILCIIAVAGSSAMIWLRKIGALFGVEWSGDGS